MCVLHVWHLRFHCLAVARRCVDASDSRASLSSWGVGVGGGGGRLKHCLSDSYGGNRYVWSIADTGVQIPLSAARACAMCGADEEGSVAVVLQVN